MIIITGASSFVGKNFVDFFNQNCVCLVRKKKNIKDKKVKQVVVDFFDKESLSKRIGKEDILIHILGITSGSLKELYKINYLITKNLVDVAKEKGVKKIIFISSAISEMKKEDMGNYGRSKLMAEEYIKNSGIEYVILKPSIIYGKENKMIGRLIRIVKGKKFVPVISNGNYKIAPVFIEDVNKIIKKSIELKGNKEYVIAGKEISMNELIDEIARIYKKRIVKIHIPIFILKIISLFKIRGFPDLEQLDRITKHPYYNTTKFKRDFKIKLVSIKEGLTKSKCQEF